MRKSMKTWSAIGMAVLAGTGLAEAAVMDAIPIKQNPALVLVDGEGGEAAEGGEGGGETPTTYALGSSDANAFSFDAKPVVTSYAKHVLTSYAAAKREAETMKTAIDAFLANPSEASLKAARDAWVKARPAYPSAPRRKLTALRSSPS